MKRQLFLCALLSLLFVSCKEDEAKMKEVVREQSQISSQGQIQAENQNLQERALEMEKDLAARHRFYQALKGEYEGIFKIADSPFKVRIVLSPSISPYNYTEYRTSRRLEEIVTDLNGLWLNASIIQWNPANPLATTSCRVNGIRPDLQKGEITITSETCSNIYSFKISSGEITESSEEQHSRELAGRIMIGAESSVPEIFGEIHPSTNPNVFSFRAKKGGRRP